MIEPISMLLLPTLINLVTGRADAKCVAPGLDQYQERRHQRQHPINHNLEKELRRSLFLALKQLAVECQKTLKPTATYFQGVPSNEAAQDFDWLKRKLADLEKKIASVDATVDQERKDEPDTPSMLSYASEVVALLQGQDLAQDPAIQAFQAQYLDKTGLESDTVPACYREAIAKKLPNLIRDNFVARLKANDDAMDAFVIESHTQLQLGQAEIKQLLAERLDLLPRMGQTLEELRVSVAEILSRLDPANPQLSDEEWQIVGRKMLAERQALTSNLFSSDEGVAINRVDVYVPLGLVERRRTERVSSAPNLDSAQGQQSQEPKTITPISEDEFFQRIQSQVKTSQHRGQRIAIIGEPGSGKTTRLQAIADWVLDNNLGLPIWVPLRQLGDRSVGDYLRQWLADATGKEALWDNFLALVAAGQVWLLLDGLDEMTTQVHDHHQRLVTGFWSEARILLSCRVNVWDGYRGALQEFEEYRNLEFEPHQVEEYISRWFRAAAQSDAGSDLWTALQDVTRSHLMDLVRNPLRLSLLCCVWLQGERTLPETQAGLYAQFVDWVDAWKQSVIHLTSPERQNLQQKLSELALMAIAGKDATGKPITRFVLRKSLLEQVFGSVDDPLCVAALRVGWLNQLGKSAEPPLEPVYGFYHATFQEYFAALGVEDWDYFLPRDHVDCPVSGKAYRIFEKSWKQVMLLWLGRADIADAEKEAFIQALVEFKGGVRDFYGYQAYFLAAAGINQFQTYSCADEIVNQLVTWGFGYFNDEKQEWRTFLDPIEEGARETIPETIRPLAIAALVRLLDTTDDDDTRWSAAVSLEKIGQGNPQAIAALVRLLDTTDDDDTRMRAAESLGKIDPGNPQAIAALVRLLDTTDDDDTRMSAADSLGKIITTLEQYAGVVAGLKDCLSDEVYENDFKRFYACYKVVWQCAENLPYPDFYQAWHDQLPTAPHPDVENGTAVGATPVTQQGNLALLPQSLAQAIQSCQPPLTCQVICIDGSRFSDPSNPAPQLYTAMKKAGCPPSAEGKPRSIADLQAYCEDDLTEHRAIALILYEDPTDAPPQGFDVAVLNQLARFSYPPIAVVVPERMVDCLLPDQFLETDPNLIATILQWLQNLER